MNQHGRRISSARGTTTAAAAARRRPDDNDNDGDGDIDEDDDLLAIHKNALLLDVHLLLSSSTSTSNKNDPQPSRRSADDHWQKLAQLGVELNAALQQEHGCRRHYPWMTGGDGPVFGVHCGSDDIPHLRAVCRYYGVGVDDEWRAVGWRDGLSSKTTRQHDVAVECWDVDDGQLLLIEAAQHLPSWVDEIGPQHCRHRCWIARGGQVVLIRPPSDNVGERPQHSLPSSALTLSLSEALTILQDDHDNHHNNHPLVETAPASVQKAIRDRIDRVACSTNQQQSSVPSPSGRRGAAVRRAPVSAATRPRGHGLSPVCGTNDDPENDNDDCPENDHNNNDARILLLLFGRHLRGLGLDDPIAGPHRLRHAPDRDGVSRTGGPKTPFPTISKARKSTVSSDCAPWRRRPTCDTDCSWVCDSWPGSSTD